MKAENQAPIEEIIPKKQLYEAIEACLDRLKTGVQVLVARSGIADGADAINDIADEILAVSLETAVQIGDRYDSSKNAYAWLLTIATNNLKDYRKKVFREHRHMDLIGNISSMAQTEARNLDDEFTEDEKLELILSHDTNVAQLENQLFALGDILSLVNESDRTILRLVYVDGMSGQELAGLLNTTEAAALMRLSRARSRLYLAYCQSEKSEGEG